MGRSVIEAVLADFDRNGPDAVRRLREQDPAGYAKTLCDLITARDLLRTEVGDRTKDTGRTARARRTRMAHKVMAALEQDLDAHGAETVARLRTEKPQAWARLLSEVCQFRLLPKTPKPAPRREPRPLRMKSLLQALTEQPVDPASALLPMTQAQALPDALAAVPRGTWPQPVAVWKPAWGAAWAPGLVDWLAIHLPGSIVLPEGHDPGKRSRPKPEAGPDTVGDWIDELRAAGRADEVRGQGFVLRRT
jgi:hypothetical protein